MRLAFFVLLFVTFLIHSPVVLAEDTGIGIQIEMLPWEKVNEVLPKNSKFTVLDVETGKRFNVQRRAGSHHADVQPLTSKDTKIMKEIYDGKWSWKRRAIIVIYKDQWIAASMHGMPHGAGALRNNFPGHFCIHFYGSVTHRTNSMDLSHKLMILKAAGQLEEYIASLESHEVIAAYVAGIKQGDPVILSSISLQNINWDQYIHSVENIKLLQVTDDEEINNELFHKVFIEIEWINTQSEKKYFKGEIYLLRFSPADAWKIDSIRFLQDIKIEK